MYVTVIIYLCLYAESGRSIGTFSIYALTCVCLYIYKILIHAFLVASVSIHARGPHLSHKQVVFLESPLGFI